MTTKRKPVKKAAKKVVKKAPRITLDRLNSDVQNIMYSLNHKGDLIANLQQRMLDVEIEKNIVHDRMSKIQTSTFMCEAKMDAHDNLYNKIRDFKKSIWWTRFCLAITITAFVIYAIITG